MEDWKYVFIDISWRCLKTIYYFFNFGSLILKTISSIIKKKSNACRFINSCALKWYEARFLTICGVKFGTEVWTLLKTAKYRKCQKPEATVCFREKTFLAIIKIQRIRVL